MELVPQSICEISVRGGIKICTKDLQRSLPTQTPLCLGKLEGNLTCAHI